MAEEHLPPGLLYDGGGDERHLKSCASCSRTLSWVELLRETGPSEGGNEPSTDALKRVLKLAGSGQPGSVLRWIEAVVLFDSFEKARNLGIRRKEAIARHIVYRLNGYDFNIDVQRAADRSYTMIGQALNGNPEATNGIDVWLQCDERLHTTLTDQFGEFFFYGLPTCEYRLTILLPGRSIMLPPFSMLES